MISAGTVSLFLEAISTVDFIICSSFFCVSKTSDATDEINYEFWKFIFTFYSTFPKVSSGCVKEDNSETKLDKNAFNCCTKKFLCTNFKKLIFIELESFE